jgi:hypothetical protein
MNTLYIIFIMVLMVKMKSKYLMKNKDIIEADSFNDMKKQFITKLEDDTYMRSLIKGIGS